MAHMRSDGVNPCYIGVIILGLYRDNRKEDGTCYSGV